MACGGYDANVRPCLLECAEAKEQPGVEYAKQFGLQSGVEGTNVIEKETAFVGEFEQARPGCICSREDASLMSGQFRFDELFGKGCAGKIDKWFKLADRIVMDGAGDNFFTRARFAEEENRSRGLRRFANLLEKIAHPRRGCYCLYTQKLIFFHHRIAKGPLLDVTVNLAKLA